MGATDFFEPANGRNLSRAFFNAKCKAAWEHGHREYSGTVYDKDDVILIDEPQRSLPEATRLAKELLDARDPRVFPKVGPAGALPIETDGNQPGWLFFGLAAC
ncbi:hypothetical protein [Streptomyces violascens]|uniref:Uncharacterized protein n=1 Tax=Streptomyces violascens TaxID=67381 RepID=A0ABQ3QVG5_9ACTN|nr:hypothetical protein [Streptomyces violascens]GGU26464.1 hypothetical protein GCM10010289_54720 [Streptomyces violascens]GHI41209.1 hypothetical protein Sviol_56170 [Streptomyces violascens]